MPEIEFNEVNKETKAKLVENDALPQLFLHEMKELKDWGELEAKRLPAEKPLNATERMLLNSMNRSLEKADLPGLQDTVQALAENPGSAARVLDQFRKSIQENNPKVSLNWETGSNDSGDPFVRIKLADPNYEVRIPSDAKPEAKAFGARLNDEAKEADPAAALEAIGRKPAVETEVKVDEIQAARQIAAALIKSEGKLKDVVLNMFTGKSIEVSVNAELERLNSPYRLFVDPICIKQGYTGYMESISVMNGQTCVDSITRGSVQQLPLEERIKIN